MHWFMEHLKANCLDFQFISSSTVKKASLIKKTIIFLNSLAEIWPMIKIIQDWMKLLNYSLGFDNWVKLYYLTISEYDKKLIAKVFKTIRKKYLEYMIWMTNDVYSIGIDNLDIIRVIYWEIPFNIDGMIQRISWEKKMWANTFYINYSKMKYDLKSKKTQKRHL